MQIKCLSLQRCGVGPAVRSTDRFWCGFTVTGWSPAGECQNRARSPAGNGCTVAVPNISLMHTSSDTNKGESSVPVTWPEFAGSGHKYLDINNKMNGDSVKQMLRTRLVY